MDILRVLSSPDLEVRRKTLSLAMDLVTSRNIEEMVLVLKKEIAKTHNTVEHEDTGKYRQLLVRTLHNCCIKFPDVSPTVIPLLMEFLSDTNEVAAQDVLIFIREAMSKFDSLRTVIIERLLEVFTSIRSAKIHRAAVWILGEYCTSSDDIQSVMSAVRQNLGEIPIVEDELRKAAGDEQMADESVSAAASAPVQQLVTADGTYATQSALVSGPASSAGAKGKSKAEEDRPPFRKYLMDGDFFIAASLATTLTKLALRCVHIAGALSKFSYPAMSYRRLHIYQLHILPFIFRYNAAVGNDEKKRNRFTSETMLVLASILHLGRSGLPAKKITPDDGDRIALCLKVLAEQSPAVVDIFDRRVERRIFKGTFYRWGFHICFILSLLNHFFLLRDCRMSLQSMLEAQAENEGVDASKAKAKKTAAKIQADAPIKFMQLSRGHELSAAGDIFEMGLNQALGTAKKESGADFSSSKLNKVGEDDDLDLTLRSKVAYLIGLAIFFYQITQLTGFSDPVYAEAYVNVNQYDIVLDVLVVNQTADTLQNCTIELATLGDLKLVERPQPMMLGPMDFCSIKANVKESDYNSLLPMSICSG